MPGGFTDERDCYLEDLPIQFQTTGPQSIKFTIAWRPYKPLNPGTQRPTIFLEWMFGDVQPVFYIKIWFIIPFFPTITLPKFNSSPHEKLPKPNRKGVVFQPPFFQGRAVQLLGEVINGLALASGFQVMPLPRHWWGNRFVDLIAAVVADALEAAAWMRRVPFWWPGLGAPLWRDGNVWLFIYTPEN